ncbi:MAG: glycosyltransferase [Acidobacteria bacterium]|nr:glycosyltransferase [Acidobacteriota bacterium]
MRVLALVEAHSLTGPAKNLIEFASRAMHPEPGLPAAEIGIVTFQRRNLDGPNAFVAAVRQAGLHIEVIPERFAFDLGVVPQLRAVLDRWQPDIIQSHNFKAHFLVRFSGLCRRYAWLAFHHGYTAPKLRVRIYNQLDRWSLRAARRIITVCRPFVLELQRMGISGSRITIQHNSILPFVAPPAREVAALRTRLEIPDQAKVILTVGRLSREKGHLDLLDAVALLRRRHPALSFRLVLAGEGPERDSIERRLAALGLSGAVLLAGHQADVRPYYAMADLFVLPSHSEGSPNALLEAMAAGIPVVATSVGGVPEIARHGETALLVERGSAGQMAGAIERLLEDGDLAMRFRMAGPRVTSTYTPEAYCRSVLTIYRQLLAAPEPAQPTGAEA